MTERLTEAQQEDRDNYIADAPQVARNLLEPHIGPGSKMVLMEHDPEKYTWQDPMRFVVDTDAMPLEASDDIAIMADRRFPAMVEMAGEGQEAETIIDATHKLLEAGSSIWIVTAHVDDITDIGFAGKIVTNLLHERHNGYRPESTLIMISKSIGEAAYLMDIEGAPEPLEIPMVSAIQTGFTRIVLPWPRSASTDEELKKLPDAEISRHNGENGVKGAVDATLKAGGALGAIAPTGRTRLVNGAMSPVNSATIGLMARPNTYVLPMIVWRQSEVPVVRFCSEPVQIDPEHPEQADDVMSLITSAMNREIPGKNFAYQAPSSRRKLAQVALENG
jgi:hypothetical protein